MIFNEYINLIQQGSIKHLCLIYGSEHFMIKKIESLFIKSLLKNDELDSGLNIYDSEPSAKELAAAIETYPFFAGRNVVIIKNSKLFKNTKKSHHNDDDKSHDEYLKILSAIPEWSYVMLIAADDIDKRRKIYKSIEQIADVVECRPLKVKDARNWIKDKLEQQGVSITRDAEHSLVSVLSLMPEISLGFLNNEIDKMITYITPKKVIQQQDIDALFAGVPEVSVFALLETLSDKDAAKAVKLLRNILESGINELNVIGLLAFHVRRLSRTKHFILQGYDEKWIANYFKLPLFIGEKLVKQSAGFSANKLMQAIVDLSHANLNIRYIDNKPVVLEKIILDLCR